MSKYLKLFWPKQILWRLTLINVLVFVAIVLFASFSIYNAACALVSGMETSVERQAQFNTTLFQFLLFSSISTLIIGSVLHFYFTKKLMSPLRELIESAKVMKMGQFPKEIRTNSEGEVAELIEQFNGLVHQLKQKEEARQKILADISHEFRTPLSNLNGYMDALSNGVIEGDTALFQSLHGEAKRLTGMIDQLEQLKEWDTVTANTLFETTEEDMKRLIQQTVDMFHWRLQEKGIDVQIEASHGSVHVYNDGVQQVISNLMDNAIRYYEGSLPIRIRGELVGADYMVSIISEGKSIPEGDDEIIFERFYRTDPSRNQNTGGTGLGLAISKEIILLHRGEIGLEREANGYRFWFKLPIMKPTVK